MSSNFQGACKKQKQNKQKALTLTSHLNGKRLKVFTLRSGRREGCLLSPLLLNTILKVLANAIRQEKVEKKKKSILIGKDVKLSLSLDNVVDSLHRKANRIYKKHTRNNK